MKAGTDFLAFKGHKGLRNAVLISVVAGWLTALAGFVLFLAGSRAAGLDASAVLNALPAAPVGLAAAGPLGYAAWMCLLMALGSPAVGAAVFAMLYLGEPPVSHR